MADPNPLATMPIAESLARQMSESLQWMSRMWGGAGAAPMAAAESPFAQAPLPRGIPSMLMPTLDPNELDKRINDLKTVAHWLEMNRVLLHSTIQTLEMQRNAIAAMQSMARAAQAGTLPAGVQAEPAAAPPGDPTAPPVGFDPMPWWNALQQQFARVAAVAASRSDSAPAESAPAESARQGERADNGKQSEQAGPGTAPRRRVSQSAPQDNPTGKPPE